MAQIYLATGKKSSIVFNTEEEYTEHCALMKKQYGIPFFEMPWPNKKIFSVFRDRQDNEIEVQYKPITLGEFAQRSRAPAWKVGGV